MKLALALLALVSLVVPVAAQMRDNRETQLSCDNAGRSRPFSCEIRETTLGPSASLDIEPSHNGGVTVKGWAQNSVLVRARVEALAENESEAKRIGSQVRVEAVGGRIRAEGPDLDGFLRSNEN